MASTPATSFSSDDGHCGKPVKTSSEKTPQALPSPQPSDSSTTQPADGVLNQDDSEIDRACRVVHDSFCGFPAQPLYHFHFEAGQQSFERFLDKLQTQGEGVYGYYKEKIRVDWWDVSGDLTLTLMTETSLHGKLGDLVRDAITRELDRVAAENPGLQPFRDNLDFVGTASLRKRSKPDAVHRWKRSPDGNFRYYSGSVARTTVLFEISYSETAKSFREKCEEYALEYSRTGCTMLGFDIPYARRRVRQAAGFQHKGYVSLYSAQPSSDPEEAELNTLRGADMFRDSAGQHRAGEILIPFELFVPINQRAALPTTSATICLTYQTLASFLSIAEQRLRADDQEEMEDDDKEGVAEPSRKRLRIRDEDGNQTTKLADASSKRQKRSKAPEVIIQGATENGSVNE